MNLIFDGVFNDTKLMLDITGVVVERGLCFVEERHSGLMLLWSKDCDARLRRCVKKMG